MTVINKISLFEEIKGAFYLDLKKEYTLNCKNSGNKTEQNSTTL